MSDWRRADASSRWIADAIARADAGSPRSQQRRLGPSEIGTPCRRRLALKIAHAEHEVLPNRRPPSLRTFVGTAVHHWLDKALGGAELPTGFAIQRERRVVVQAGLREADGEPQPELSGTADLVVLHHGGGLPRRAWVRDFKVVGPTTLEKARGLHVDVPYEAQVDLYGLGVERTLAGGEEDELEVVEVGIVYVPACGDLDDMVTLARPYNRERALEHLQRYERARAWVAAQYDDATEPATGGDPSAVELIVEGTSMPGGTADDHCDSCPFLGAAHAGVTLCSGFRRPLDIRANELLL